MSNIEKISISLTSEMIGAVNAAVQSGDYASQSEVIREALRHWRKQAMPALQHADELRLLAMEGIKSGAGRLGSSAAVKKEARRRLAAKQKKH